MTLTCTKTAGDTNETSPSEDQNSRSQSPHYESDDTVILKTDSDSDTDYLDATESCKQKRNSKCETEQMRSPLPSLALACDGVGVSSRGAAIIACALLEDMNIVSEEDQSKVIDENKIQRERKKTRIHMQHLHQEGMQILEGLYFDGRKNMTLVIDTNKGKNVRKSIKEEHIVLVQEPGSKYLGHVVPTSGHCHSVQSSICEFLNQNKIDTSKIVAVGCDGTVVNTGTVNGVIALFESELKRPVQWHCLSNTR